MEAKVPQNGNFLKILRLHKMACIENRKLVLVGGKNGSNQKMSENKKFLIISVNLNPKCQVPNPKIAFYQNTLQWLWFCLLLCVIPKPNKQNLSCKSTTTRFGSGSTP